MSPPKIIHGRIVWATIPDPQGRNPKKRRCVVISSNASIDSGQPIRIVGITSELTASPEEHYVRLPFATPPLPCWTGLVEDSAALCTWTVDISASKLESTKWFVKPTHLDAIQRVVKELEDEGFPVPCFTI